MTLQEALRLLRYELGYTQEDFARKINKGFVTVNRWENGKSFPSRSAAKDILLVAKNEKASEKCITYLNDVLLPDSKRTTGAAKYGFPEIDREFLFQLADDSMNGVYVIDAQTYSLLYVNRKAEQLAIRTLAENGRAVKTRSLATQRDKRCFHYFANNNSPCEFCPLSRIGGGEYHDEIMTVPGNGRRYRIHAKENVVKGHKVYVIYLTDVTDEDIERNAIYELTNDIPCGVGIYHFYQDERIVLEFMNQRLFQMIGAERGHALLSGGKTDLCTVHQEDREALLKEIRAAITEKRDIGIDLRMRMMDGRYCLVHLKGKLIKTDTERRTFYCLFQKLAES